MKEPPDQPLLSGLKEDLQWFKAALFQNVGGRVPSPDGFFLR